ncbi:MAG: glucose-6-phosphate isomerase [Bacteroidales bacterium]|nr:glucose-6-phosphate isomerase [Bacteroidales bacterium]
MVGLKVNIQKADKWVSRDELSQLQAAFEKAQDQITHKTGKGNDFLGWIDLPDTDKALLESITADANELAAKSEIIVVIGIGGSYLGARAVIDALNNPFNHLLDSGDGKKPVIIYAGNQISEEYHAQLLKLLDKKNYSIIVISKSGTTTEPAIAFRLLKAHIEKKYGSDEARKRIIAITDKSKGALRTLAGKEGYKSYVIADNVGGRFSVLSPVGLLPIAAAGFNINRLIQGALAMKKLVSSETDVFNNPAGLYAIARNILYRKGKTNEILAGFNPQLSYITEWWKQLYGESEGKDGKGIFPAGLNFSTDLHSLGQYVQDGLRNIFETMVSVDKPSDMLTIPFDSENLDGLNFISGMRISEVNKMAELGTTLAHLDGGVPVLSISIPQIDEYSLGELIFFFEYACALSGYILDVNPFDQPGVEDYKNNMFALLGKPGYEKKSEEIRKRIH